MIEYNIITYEPDNLIKKGYFTLFKEIYCEIKNNSWLIYQLFRRDLLAFYKQSFIGIFWAFIVPLISVGTFILMNRSGIFNIGNVNVPYVIYAVLGMAFWQLFSSGLIGSSNSLIKTGQMIAKINFSKKSLIIASTGQAIIAFMVQLGLVGFLFFLYHYIPEKEIILIPIFIIPIYLLTLGLGFILSLINGIMRDVGNILSTFITFFLFLTPILYERPTEGLLGSFTTFNPLFYLISVPRDLILYGTTNNFLGYFLSILLSISIFIICIVAFHLTESRVAERI